MFKIKPKYQIKKLIIIYSKSVKGLVRIYPVAETRDSTFLMVKTKVKASHKTPDLLTDKYKGKVINIMKCAKRAAYLGKISALSQTS